MMRLIFSHKLLSTDRQGLRLHKGDVNNPLAKTQLSQITQL